MTFGIMPAHTRVIDTDAKQKIRSLSSENRALFSTIENLEGTVDRLALITQALWELLRDKVGIAESELTDLIEQIDLRGGAMEDKLAKKPSKCAKCNQIVSIRTNVCFYCGFTHVTPPD